MALGGLPWVIRGIPDNVMANAVFARPFLADGCGVAGSVRRHGNFGNVRCSLLQVSAGRAERVRDLLDAGRYTEAEAAARRLFPRLRVNN